MQEAATQEVATQSSTPGRLRGYIRLIGKGGYGFIRIDGGGDRSAFTHVRYLENREERKGFKKGAYVEFTLVDSKPTPRAVKVKVLS